MYTAGGGLRQGRGDAAQCAVRSGGRLDRSGELSDVLGFEEIDRTMVAVVGGKGAQLGELTRIEGIRVPEGFCVTTGAFRRVVADALSIEGLVERLSGVQGDDRQAIGEISAEIRRVVESVLLPDGLGAAIAGRLAELGEQGA